MAKLIILRELGGGAQSRLCNSDCGVVIYSPRLQFFITLGEEKFPFPELQKMRSHEHSN